MLGGDENAVKSASETEVRNNGTMAPPVIKINVQNNYDKTFYLAFIYYDADEAEWTTRGWYEVNEGKTRSITFKTYLSEFHMYGEFSDGTPLPEGAGSLERTVIDEEFIYRQGEECPEGSGRKTVQFTEYRVNEEDYKDGTSVVNIDLGP
jgi:uncharacterized membrane protein